ncbi:MAG TPA: zf-HC2 domain-containing protein [Anaerolineaceae bacterium]|nr:zf-HC2 domain-containing protein [Anaerolineaceae bacterium]
MDHNHCKDLLSTLSDYMDGELSAELCTELEMHLRSCENCRIVVNTLHKTIELYQATAGDESLPTPVRERLFRNLHLEDYLES